MEKLEFDVYAPADGRMFRFEKPVSPGDIGDLNISDKIQCATLSRRCALSYLVVDA